MIDIPKQMRTPNPAIDYTSKDYEAFRSMMLKHLQIRLPSYTDTSQTDAGIVIMELLARGLDILSFYQDVMANEAFFSTARDRESAVRWSKGLGYVPKNKTSAQHKQVFVLGYKQNTDFIIEKGTKLRTRVASAEKPETFELASDFIIPAGKLGDEKDDEGNYIYTAVVAHGTTIKDDLLGTSTGQPDQEFKLNFKSVLADNVIIYINEGSGFEQWTQVKTFIDSTKTDKHYTVFMNEIDEAVISFGNDLSGKIPAPYINGIYAYYRIGGGEIGNVPPMNIIEMVDNIAVISKTFNIELIDYGVEHESIEEIKINAPAYLRTLWRAVHIDDHSDLALINFNNIQFAKSIQNKDDRNAADLWIYLKNNEPLTESLLKELYSFYDKRKMVGNSVIIHPAEFYKVDLECSLIVKDDYYADEIEQETLEFLHSYLALGQVDFNTHIPLALLEAVTLHAVAGLRSFRITNPVTDMITPAPYEIVILGDVELKTIGGALRTTQTI